MRKLKYLSPSSLSNWEKDREGFYLQRLADNRLPREPQTRPMAVGSAFDAYVKSYLYENLIGKDAEYAFETIFEQQVESHNRDFGLLAGKHIFESYQSSGVLASLILALSKAKFTPRFEWTVEGRVGHSDSSDGVPLLGRPDVYYITVEDAHVIVDWKVNGYCSKASPTAGYINLEPGHKVHRDAVTMVIGGLEINVTHPLETVNKDWASQLATYGWLLGEEIGSQFVCCIEQVACDASKAGVDALDALDALGPDLRFATHRNRVSEVFQKSLLARYQAAWTQIQSGWIFENLSREESQSRCALLDKYYEFSEDEDWKSIL